MKLPKVTWAQHLGPESCKYLVRWILDMHFFSIRLHHWLKSDDSRHQHDHPWDFWSFVIKGEIIELTDTDSIIRKAGTLNYFSAEYKHCVSVKKPTWTLLITGPHRRPKWGFWVNGKFRKRNKYFFEHGHHNPCE